MKQIKIKIKEKEETKKLKRDPVNKAKEYCLNIRQECRKCKYESICQEIQKRGYPKFYQYTKETKFYNYKIGELYEYIRK